MILLDVPTSVAALSPAGGGGGAATTWNPSDKNAHITLSNGNLTATGATSAFQGVRSTGSTASSLKYFEISFSAAVDISQVGVGVGNSSASLSTFNDANSFGWFGDGKVYNSGGIVSTVSSYVTGNVLRIAFNGTANLIWFAVGAGAWNAGGDPAANTGGISTSAMSGPFLPLLILDATNDAATANFGATSYSFAAPSGYGNW